MKVSSVRPLLSSTSLSKKNRSKEEPWRAWYNTQEWRDLRNRIFVRDLYTCQREECKRLIGNTSKLVAHHKVPHKGNATLFWDENNIITVCKPCHDGPIASEERKAIWGTWY